MENAWLIVGLGNPGGEYARTRHNAGYMAVDGLARRWRTDWTEEAKFKSRVSRCDRGNKRVVLCQPLTFMNDSGEAVGAVAGYYRVPLGRLLVVVDDADLPLGELRLRPRGSSGGHHGLESVQSHLNAPEFTRLRIGIGRGENKARQITGHVLGAFRGEEAGRLDALIGRVCDQMECWLDEGVLSAMNRFNGKMEF